MIEDFWQIAAVGFAAQMVEGALGMAYGLTSTWLLLTLGYSPAAVSAAVHLAETATTVAAIRDEYRLKLAQRCGTLGGPILIQNGMRLFGRPETIGH
ncbi:hypothetical protein SuNHUV7_15210 (plasmid) [Pseudoseohaeicola sp. NH-UV-7]|uniref:hypothetical protein n=1 Tax=Sulfitobacter sp. TBRI5 TaxID=2989732 RepID=UPI003A6D9AF7